MRHPAFQSTRAMINYIYSHLQTNTPTHGLVPFALILNAIMSRTQPLRDDLGLYKTYPAQHAYSIPLFYFNPVYKKRFPSMASL